MNDLAQAILSTIGYLVEDGDFDAKEVYIYEPSDTWEQIGGDASPWIWGGDWSPGSIDAMHVQAARVHS